ncbi:UNVERIFIED_CONTAM: hypothetical protein HDU68_001946 [Siphonaria sp. JEL0065]|nr:hypothetical protein HDU68_001946 [Siphonaria sp. JEL0065]
MLPKLANQPLESHWLYNLPTETLPTPDPTFDKSFHVVIIGGGLSGVSTAYHLAKLNSSLKIAILEARTVAGGATGRNGGLVAPRVAGSYQQVATRVASALGLVQDANVIANETIKLRRFGFDNAYALRNFCAEFVAGGGTLDPLFSEFSVGSVTGLTSVEERNKVLDEMESWRPYLEEGVDPLPFLVESDDVIEWTGMRRNSMKHFAHGGIVYKHWCVQPANLALAIAKSAIQHGAVSIYQNCLVSKINRIQNEDGSWSFSVETSIGEFTTSTHIIYATNAWTSCILPNIQITPIRNQLISTTPLPARHKWRQNAFALMMNEGYEYASGRVDGRVVLGGMRYLSVDMDVGCDRDDLLNETVSKALRGYLPANFDGFGGKDDEGDGSSVEVEREWSGIMGWTQDKFPYVGPLAGIKDCGQGEIIIAGCWGHGMARCFLSGLAVAEIILGKEPSGNFPKCFLPTTARIENQEK